MNDYSNGDKRRAFDGMKAAEKPLAAVRKALGMDPAEPVTPETVRIVVDDMLLRYEERVTGAEKNWPGVKKAFTEHNGNTKSFLGSPSVKKRQKKEPATTEPSNPPQQ